MFKHCAPQSSVQTKGFGNRAFSMLPQDCGMLCLLSIYYYSIVVLCKTQLLTGMATCGPSLTQQLPPCVSCAGGYRAQYIYIYM